MMNIYKVESVAAIAGSIFIAQKFSSELLSKQMKNEFPAYVYAWHMLNAPAQTHTLTRWRTLTNTIKADKGRAWINITHTLRCATLCKCQRQVFTPRRSTIKFCTNVWKMHNIQKHVCVRPSIHISASVCSHTYTLEYKYMGIGAAKWLPWQQCRVAASAVSNSRSRSPRRNSSSRS